MSATMRTLRRSTHGIPPLLVFSQGNVALPLSGIPAGDGRLWPALGRSEGDNGRPSIF